MFVPSIGVKQRKISEMKNIPDIKNVSFQKSKKGELTIMFQTKLIQSKEVIDFINLNKSNYKIEEIKN